MEENKPPTANELREQSVVFLKRILVRLHPKRWHLLPTSKDHSVASNSICTITRHSFETIEHILQHAGLFQLVLDSNGTITSQVTTDQARIATLNTFFNRIDVTFKTYSLVVENNKAPELFLFAIRKKPRQHEPQPVITFDHRIIEDKTANAIRRRKKSPVHHIAIGQETNKKLHYLSRWKSKREPVSIAPSNSQDTPSAAAAPLAERASSKKKKKHPEKRGVEATPIVYRRQLSFSSAISILRPLQQSPQRTPTVARAQAIADTNTQQQQQTQETTGTRVNESDDAIETVLEDTNESAIGNEAEGIENVVAATQALDLTSNTADHPQQQQRGSNQQPSVNAASTPLPCTPKTIFSNDYSSDDGSTSGQTRLPPPPASAQNHRPPTRRRRRSNRAQSLPEWEPPVQMVIAQQLDFSARDEDGLRPPRMQSNTSISITVTKNSRPTETMRWAILLVARDWGYSNKSLLNKHRKAIAEAACRLVTYDWGFSKPPKAAQVKFWNDALDDSLQNGDITLRVAVAPTGIGNMVGRMVDNLDKQYPGYLAALFREAQITEGNKASWKDLATAVNFSSQKASDERPAVKLSEWQLNEWFKSKQGKVKTSVTRPILTERHKQKRFEWVQALLYELRDHYDARPGDDEDERSSASSGEKKAHEEPHSGPPYYVFLDEKWFYVTSRRRKIKFLPMQPGETVSADHHYPPERLASRRFATKVMYMGVVACPHPDKEFDGKILLLRVSKTKKAQKNTFYKLISDSYEINKEIHADWSKIHDFDAVPDITVGEFLNLLQVVEEWQIDQQTRDHLVLRYCQWNPNFTKKKWVTMDEGDVLLSHVARVQKGNTAAIPVKLEHMHLQFVRRNGEEYEEDCTCDSVFMKEHMLEIGAKIREAYHWVPHEQEIVLIMDNAGGHGTKDAIDEYVSQLQQIHNVRVHWQVPRSPECNLLDLGIWCGLQRYVEKLHRKKTKSSTGALARTIEDAWSRYDSYDSFRNVYKRWANKVLWLIAQGNGDNNLVDAARKEVVVPIVMQAPPNVEATADDDDALDDAAAELLGEQENAHEPLDAIEEEEDEFDDE